MKPDTALVLGQCAQTLAVRVAPALAGEHLRGQALLAAAVAGMAAQQADAAAEHRMATLRDMQAVLAQLQPWVPPLLQPAVAEAQEVQPASLRLSDLDAALRPALRALIALQAHLETLPGRPAREAERACLDAWDRLAARRRLVLGG